MAPTIAISGLVTSVLWPIGVRLFHIFVSSDSGIPTAAQGLRFHPMVLDAPVPDGLRPVAFLRKRTLHPRDLPAVSRLTYRGTGRSFPLQGSWRNSEPRPQHGGERWRQSNGF